jgi:DNA-binding transcriptional ArsR family regulator
MLRWRRGAPIVLRVHLTARDLLRIKFASEPAPLIELGFALAALHGRDPLFGRWRRGAVARFPTAARPLLDVIPATATGPLFLDPITTALAEGLEEVQRTPTTFVTAELQRLYPAGPQASWIRLLAGRDRQTWRDLHAAQRLAHRDLIVGAAARAHQGYQAELAWRSRLIAKSGVQAALSALHPSISWDQTMLQITAADQWDLYPRGNGLTLMPSVYWTGRPMLTWHPDGSVAVIYGALTPLPLIGTADGDPLAGLLGHTRATLLRLMVTERTTSDLALELPISLATVSAHTKTLRAAGLIVTVRAGKAVLHSITPLGERLLHSCG